MTAHAQHVPTTCNNHTQQGPGLFKSSAQVTLHCLTGCGIGEFLGLFIGTLAGWGAVATISLAVALAFVIGIGMAAGSVMRNHGITLAAALATVWLGEVVSISVMEIAMNDIDYAVGGIGTGSVLAPMFWIGFLLALPAG